MAKEDDLHNKKTRLLEKAEARLNKQVISAEKKLLSSIISKFIDKLDTKDGIIVNNAKNIGLIQVIDDVIDAFNSTTNRQLLSQYISDLNKNSNTNRSFFGAFDESKGINFKAASERVNKVILDRLGIKANGKLKKGGFIDEFANDRRIAIELKEVVTKGITGNVSLSQLKKEVKGFVQGSAERAGKLCANYNTFIYDTYSQIDRMQTGLYAQELGLQAFRYAGGTIDSTRQFCCQRNNLIFTVDEAKKWSTISFQGKTTPYNPLVDLGGFNCRHTTQYISNVRAARLRDDLKLNDKGMLIKNPKGQRQLLNKC